MRIYYLHNLKNTLIIFNSSKTDKEELQYIFFGQVNFKLPFYQHYKKHNYFEF